LFRAPRGELMMSMSAQVFFVQAAAKNVLIVPNTAVRTVEDATTGRPPKAQVTVVTPSGATETRAVQLGLRNRISAEIVSGLKEGENVVVDTAPAADTSQSRMRMLRMY
jgi:membrane fusion protein, macrolide-specific efflux system